MNKRKYKYPASMFCTDYLIELNDCLEESECWKVVMAVLNKVFEDEEPVFQKKYLYRFYEDLLYTTQEAYDKYMSDGRRKSSPINGEKGGRPKKSKVEEHTEYVRDIIREERKNKVYEEICKEPFKYCDGASWEDITHHFYSVEGHPDRLMEALQSLSEEGKIEFRAIGNGRYTIKMITALTKNG